MRIERIIASRTRALAAAVALAGIPASLLSVPARAAFEDLGAGARAPGMGDAFVAVADDVYAIHYNPAGLGLLARPQFGASYSKLYWGLSDGSNLSTSFLGYAAPIAEGRRGTWAAAWNSFSLDTSLYREDAFYLSYGRRLISGARGDLLAGTSLKYLRSSFGSFQEASDSTDGIVVNVSDPDPVLSGGRGHGAFDADLGLLYRFKKHYSLGLQLTHVPQPDMAFSGSDSDPLPIGAKVGVNYRSLISNLVAQFDTQKAPDGTRDKIFTVGAERWFPRLFVGDFGLRGALGLGTRGYKRLSCGVSYRTRRMVLDYGFSLPVGVSSTAGSHRLSLTFRFGRATDEEESLENVLEAMRDLKARARALDALEAQGLSPRQKAAFEEYLAQARLRESQARYKAAIGEFSKALVLVPADKDLLERFSRLNLIAQSFPELPDYGNDPGEAALHLGAMAYLDGRDLEAMDKVSLAKTLRPDNPRVENLLSQLELATGIKRLTAFKETPKSLILHTKMTRAESALREKDYPRAVELSLAVLREDDKMTAAWRSLGTAYFALKDYDSSLRAWRKAYALEKSPSIRQAIRGYLRSIARVLKSRQAEAARTVRPLPEKPKLTGREREEIFNRGIDHYTKREFNRAAEAFRTILDAYPDDEEARRALRRVREDMRWSR